MTVALALAACGGDDGEDGAASVGSRIVQTTLPAGSSACFNGGVEIRSGLDSNANGELDSSEVVETTRICDPSRLDTDKNFNRIAYYPVCSQIEPNCNDATVTVAEITAASSDGRTLIYTDSPGDQVGFVDITDPVNPAGLGTRALGGEPTSVAVKGRYAVVGVNTSTDFVNVAGELAVFDLADTANIVEATTQRIVLGGQPDSIAVSPDGNFIAVVLENERDEDLGDGAPPQLPAGSLIIVDASAADPNNWTTSSVDLTGIASLFAADPEPEYVDINNANIAVLTLQENNHLILVDLSDGSIVNDFSAGSVDLSQVDATEEDAALILQTESLSAVPREPDGVAWINDEYFATADEGDLDGGSRGFTIFNTQGEVVFSSGNSLDHLAARFGHYPDARSGNKGNEPENAEVGVFGDSRYLFIASERSSLIFVYDVADPKKPLYKQTLPAALGPEGLLAIPSRNLLIASSEEDERGGGFRGGLNIYSYGTADATYPSLRSVDRVDGTPIPWSAMSGLAADPANDAILYAVEDSFYGSNRILTLDISDSPVRLIGEMRITDGNNALAGTAAVAIADSTLPATDAARVGVFDSLDRAALINADGTVNIDPEGIAVASDGGFWVVSEGSGTVGESNRPVNSLNFLFKTDRQGVIESVVTLPTAVNQVQRRFGFEGVAEDNGKVYVAFQRDWDAPLDEAEVRIGVYDIAGAAWSFLRYPLDAPTSRNTGGWVGLSDLTAMGNGQFLIVERDNQAGPDAAVKRLYRFDVSALTASADFASAPLIGKTLVRDLLAEGDLSVGGGLVFEKIEGSALTRNGEVWIINDNDGVDDNSGETRLINLGAILN